MAKSKKAPVRFGSVVIYRDRKKEWRWRFIANGNVMADSAEGYTRRRAARRAWERFNAYIFTEAIQIVDSGVVDTRKK